MKSSSQALFFLILIVVAFAIFIYSNSENVQTLTEEVEVVLKEDENNESVVQTTKNVTSKKILIERSSNQKIDLDMSTINDEGNSGKVFKLPPIDALKFAADALERRKKLVSYGFESKEEWRNVFLVDEYSEWGNAMSDELRDNILGNKNSNSRAANFESVECKTRFCEISFSFEEGVPESKRNSIHPDMFSKSDPSLSYASFYDKESERQSVFVERCLDCTKKLN